MSPSDSPGLLLPQISGTSNLLRCSPVARRALLLLVLAALLGGCGDDAPPPDAKSRLRSFLVGQARALPDPWVKVHLLLALGPDEALVQSLGASIAYDIEGRPFVPKGVADQRADAHRNMTACVLHRIGLPGFTALPTARGPITIEELQAAALARTDLDSEAYLAESGWTLYLLAQGTGPLPDGRSRADFLGRELERLLAAQHRIAEAAEKGALTKDNRGIFAHPCGGFHWIQGAFARPADTALLSLLRAPAARQWELLQARLEHEPPLYQAGREVADSQLPPGMSRADWGAALDVQELKFYGHWLETVAQLVEDGLLSREQAASPAAQALAGLEAAVGKLDARRLLDGLAARYADPRSRQLAYDVVGDACHAYHGWTWWERVRDAE